MMVVVIYSIIKNMIIYSDTYEIKEIYSNGTMVISVIHGDNKGGGPNYKILVQVEKKGFIHVSWV